MLNEQQRKAVYTHERFLFLLAGAGTGKTRVIVERIKYLISQGVEPQYILAITFTNRAANEMRLRIRHRGVAVHTFHQFCYQTLKKYQSYAYRIASDAKFMNEDEHLLISKYKNSHYQLKKPKFFDVYQEYLIDHHLKDFDDILLDFYQARQQLKKNLKYRYIFVDEFQDTNRLQYMILKQLVQDQTALFCVGDPDQSIYKFRGAQEKIIEQFVHDFRAAVYTLTTNYRSVDSVLKLANLLIRRNNRTFKKQLTGVHHDLINPYLIESDTQDLEAKTIIECINRYIKSGIKTNEIAVLYRDHQRSYRLRYQLKSMYDKGISLMSLHQAKGLEFMIVFIIGLEEGVLPSYHAKTLVDVQEERRLFFVGTTRAKQVLYLSYVRYNNETERVRKSRFLKELKKGRHLLKKHM